MAEQGMIPGKVPVPSGPIPAAPKNSSPGPQTGGTVSVKPGFIKV